MQVVTTPKEMQALALTWRRDGLKIGLVPTMGWFHAGHLALMRKARTVTDRVVVSLFVNPIQFGPTEDLDNYPHDLERDRRLAEAEGVAVLYAPDVALMYPEGCTTRIHVDGLTAGLCGASRPGHFDGVTTVVAKLFNLTLPHSAVFGEKDFQQLAVIRQMVRDLNFPIEIIGHPIVREQSGLAMSSRNTYLKEDEMDAAHSLSKAITHAKKMVKQAERPSPEQIKEAVSGLIVSHPQCIIDYVEIVDRTSLQPCERISSESMLVLAVNINQRIRLLDNSALL
ncbi:MAG: pantoate--beta-alanine ligase [Proteobacteria bacterium]|nr:pantoate--beta-alanine ligase [Pseudomonadota bacterium]